MIDIFNFSFRELIHTDQQFDNIPITMEIVRNMVYSAECLQVIRNGFNSPITVNSGYRSCEVNKAVGGVSKSWHLQGLAYDITSTFPWKFEELVDVVNCFVDEHPDMVREHIVYESKKFIHLAFKFD